MPGLLREKFYNVILIKNLLFDVIWVNKEFKRVSLIPLRLSEIFENFKS